MAAEAAEARNRAIHQPWAAIAEADGVTRGLNARLDTRRARFTLSNPQELEEIDALMDRAATAGAALAGVLMDASEGGATTPTH